MLKLVCLTLIYIEIEWQYDSKEMKLKCRTKVDDEKLVDDDKFIEDFIRQRFLKFYVYINKVVKNQASQSSSKQRRSGPPGTQQKTESHPGSHKTMSSGDNNVSGEIYIVNLYL